MVRNVDNEDAFARIIYFCTVDVTPSAKCAKQLPRDPRHSLLLVRVVLLLLLHVAVNKLVYIFTTSAGVALGGVRERGLPDGAQAIVRRELSVLSTQRWIPS